MNNRISLTAAQLNELTGFHQNQKVIEALTTMNVPFKVRPNGTPFVSLHAINPPKHQDDEIPTAVLTLI